MSSLRQSLILALLAFCLFSVFPLLSPPLQNSPDERANAFFAELFRTQHAISFLEPLERLTEGRIVPRSMRAIGERVVPVGFPGFPVLFGILSVFGSAAVPFLSPLLMALAVFALHRCLSRHVPEDIAFWGTFFFLTHPAVWYYTSRGLFPNAAFVALLVLCGSVLASGMRERLRLPLAGALLGLASGVRMFEMIWALPLCLWFAAHVAPKRRLQAWLHVSWAFALFFIPFFLLQHDLYGGSLVGGYVQAASGTGNLFFPFGFHPRDALRTLWSYGFLLAPLTGLLAVFGAYVVVKKRPAGRHMLLATIGVAAYLVAVYGSWRVVDLPQDGHVSVGVSYARYWLPLFAASALFAAFGARELMNFVPNLRVRRVAACALALIVAFGSWYTVWLATPESLSSVRYTLWRYQAVKEDVLQLVPPHAVIVVDTTDKIFFPERRVMVGLRDVGTYRTIPILLREVPVYYFGLTLPPEDLATLREKRFPAGIGVEVRATFGSETLYQFTK